MSIVLILILFLINPLMSFLWSTRNLFQLTLMRLICSLLLFSLFSGDFFPVEGVWSYMFHAPFTIMFRVDLSLIQLFLLFSTIINFILFIASRKERINDVVSFWPLMEVISIVMIFCGNFYTFFAFHTILMITPLILTKYTKTLRLYYFLGLVGLTDLLIMVSNLLLMNETEVERNQVISVIVGGLIFISGGLKGALFPFLKTWKQLFGHLPWKSRYIVMSYLLFSNIILYKNFLFIESLHKQLMLQVVSFGIIWLVIAVLAALLIMKNPVKSNWNYWMGWFLLFVISNFSYYNNHSWLAFSLFIFLNFSYLEVIKNIRAKSNDRIAHKIIGYQFVFYLVTFPLVFSVGFLLFLFDHLRFLHFGVGVVVISLLGANHLKRISLLNAEWRELMQKSYSNFEVSGISIIVVLLILFGWDKFPLI